MISKLAMSSVYIWAVVLFYRFFDLKVFGEWYGFPLFFSTIAIWVILMEGTYWLEEKIKRR